MEPFDQPGNGPECPHPEKLAEALRRLNKVRLMVPRSVDERILADAKAHLQRFAPSIWLRQRAVRWAALAATFVAGCFLSYFFLVGPMMNRPPHATTADLNHDGHVDILDAFELARQVQSGERLNHHWDFNGDGQVTELDADAIAQQAVRL